MWELCHRPITGPGVSDLPFGVVIESPPAAAGTDEKVAIDGDTADYLDNVLVAGNGITLTPDGNTLEVAADDEKVAIDGGTADYLDNVLIAGTNITLTPDTNTLEVAASDEKVAIYGGSSDYLDSILIAGNGVTLDVDGNTLVVAAEAEDPSTTIDTLGSSSEGSETAATDTWTANGTNGLALWQTVRTVYSHTGDKKLYEFRRKLTFDRWGRLYSVSGETKIEVDAPGIC